MKVGVGIRRAGAHEREAQWPVPLCERLHGTMGLQGSVPVVNACCASGTRATWVSPQESSYGLVREPDVAMDSGSEEGPAQGGGGSLTCCG